MAPGGLQVGRLLEHDDRDAARDDQLVDHPHRAADIFRRIHLNPLAPENTNYLLWTILGFLIVVAVLVVTRPARRRLRPGAHVQPRLRRPHGLFDRAGGDAAVGAGGALWLIGMRNGQGAPGRQLERDHHRRVPENQHQRVASIAGTFIGRVVLGCASVRE
jgi:hypothetical protein